MEIFSVLYSTSKKYRNKERVDAHGPGAGAAGPSGILRPPRPARTNEALTAEVDLLADKLKNAVELINQMSAERLAAGLPAINAPTGIRRRNSGDPASSSNDGGRPTPQRSGGKGKSKGVSKTLFPATDTRLRGETTAAADDDTEGEAPPPGSVRKKTAGRSRRPFDRDSDSDSEVFEERRKASASRFRRQTSALPGVKPFKFGEAEADWTSWILQFVDTVKGHFEPATNAELYSTCLRLIPTYLNPMAHSVYAGCKYKDNWVALVVELEEAFDDPEIRQNWEMDRAAYKWDMVQPLHVYKGNVMRYVNKFDSELRGSTEALRKNYYARFLAGLPEDYQNFIDQQLYDGKQSIDHALRAAQKWKSIKKRKEGEGKKEKDVGASVTFAGATGVTFENSNAHERLRTVEQGIERINTHLNSLTARSFSNDRRSPHRGYSPNRSYSNSRYQDTGYGQYPQPTRQYGDPQQYRGRPPRRFEGVSSRDCLDRHKERRGGYYSNDRRGQQYPRGQRQEYRGYNRGSQRHYQKRGEEEDEEEPPRKSDGEGAGMLQPELESCDEADETVNEFLQWREENEEEEFDRFAAAKHQAQENY